MAPFNNDDNKVTYFAETDSRNKRMPFGIKSKDRSRHTYVIGKTGMGKSTLLENMAVQDINNNEGLAFIDPHGKTAELLLDYIPQDRIKDVLYFAPFDLEFPVSFNVMEDVGMEKRHLVANGLMSAFKKIWVDAWSARMEYILNNILLSLLEFPGATLIGVNRMLVDKAYRNKVVENITDPSVKAFWTDEFAKYGEKYMQEAGAAIQNKIGQFISNPLVRNIIGQPKSTFDIRKIMDERKILIINLSKGRVGEANANLLGSMLITKIYLAAMSRADLSPAVLAKSPNFYLYVDEFQSFANESFADILSEARKYKLNLTIAHQYIEQMSDEVRAAVFGNVGTMITFRVGSYDAEVLEKEFAPLFTAEDMVNLGFVQIYLKLMIDGISSQPFSATTLPPIEKPAISFKEEIIQASREQFARPRAQVEDEIKIWHQPVALSPAPGQGGRLESGPRRDGDRDRRDGRDGDRKPARGLADALQGIRLVPRAEKRPDARTDSRPEPRVRDDHRELELRSIISENYKKNAEANKKDEDARRRREEERKRAKNPSPENIASLRDALASVLKEAGVTAQNNQNQNQDQGKDPTPASKQAEAKAAPAQHAHKPEHDIHRPVPGEVRDTPPQTSQRESRKEPRPAEERSYVPRKPKEVPEDVLRKILEV